MSSPKRKEIQRKKSFESESALVTDFVNALERRSSKFGKLNITREWDHAAGYVDVLARDKSKALIAFEAKLGNWRRAFEQAYRNTAYADLAYVLLPESTVHRAYRHKGDFENFGVGLCSFDGQRVNVLVEAVAQEPLLKWIRQRAHQHFDELKDEHVRSRQSSSVA